jgi:hypothetical protein
VTYCKHGHETQLCDSRAVLCPHSSLSPQWDLFTKNGEKSSPFIENKSLHSVNPKISSTTSQNGSYRAWMLACCTETIGQGIRLVNTKYSVMENSRSTVYYSLRHSRWQVPGRHSTLGRFPASFCRATYFDIRGLISAPQPAKDASADKTTLPHRLR